MDRGRYKQRAFTLLEMAAVMTIIALLAAAVGVSTTGWFRPARLRDALGQLAFIDRLTRQHAQRFDRSIAMEIDLDKGTMMRVDDPSAPERTHRFQLPSDLRIQRVVTASQEVNFGHTVIPCSSKGHTPTYALLVAGPDPQQQWVVFAGLTGQAITVDHEEEIKMLLGQLVP